MAKRVHTIKRNWTTEFPTVAEFNAGGEWIRRYDAATLPQNNQTRLMVAGIFQKVGDSGALPMGATLAEKFAEMDATWETLVSGEFNRKPESLTPEQRAENLRITVCAAWISLSDGRDEGAFTKFVNDTARQNSAALQMSITPQTVIDGLSKHPKIVGAIAKLRKPTGVSLEFGDI